MTRRRPFFNGRQFRNHPEEEPPLFVLSSIGMYLKRWLTFQQTSIQELHTWHNHQAISPSPLSNEHNKELTIVWIGHATFLIQHQNYTIITDPVFESLTFLFPRLIAPGIQRNDLPAIDAVYISHNHRDHLEQSTIEFLTAHSTCIFYVPQGDEHWLQYWNVPRERIVTSTWWDSHTIPSRRPTSQQATATFLPAQHWSQRSWNDTNRSLWGSWMFTFEGHNIYFAGDTAYGPHFTEIADAFPEISCALMPIGPCEPAAYLKKSHLSAEESGIAFQQLRAQTFIPMHWGTYGFGTEAPLLPLRRITAWWDHNDIPQQLIPLRMGIPCSLNLSPGHMKKTTRLSSSLATPSPLL